MPFRFDQPALTAVLAHMNDHHADDNLLIARAHGRPDARDALMTGFDGDGADWEVTDADGTSAPLRVAWPAGPITERIQVRQQVVALYDAACRALDVEPRPH